MNATPKVEIFQARGASGNHILTIAGQLYYCDDEGSSYSFTKSSADGGDGHSDRVEAPAGRPISCTCRGWRFGSGKGCRHMAGAAAMIAAW